MKKLLFIIFCMVLLIGSISAFNVKHHDKETGVISIEKRLWYDPFGWIFDSNISDMTLKTPHVNIVTIGYSQFAEVEIINYGDSPDIFGGFELYDIKDNNKTIERKIDIKYKAIESSPNYVEVCDKNRLANGSISRSNCRKEQKGFKKVEVWNDLTNNSLPKGKVTIGFFTEVKPKDYVEWIPKIYGVKISEWAIWGASGGNVIYYKMDESSGNLTDENGNYEGIASGLVYSIPGIINTAVGADGSQDINTNIDIPAIDGADGSFSFQLWINATGAVSGNTMATHIGGADAPGTIALFGDLRLCIRGDSTSCTFMDYVRVTNVWQQRIYTFNGTSNDWKLYVNGTEVNSTNVEMNENTGRKIHLLNEADGAGGDANNVNLDEFSWWNRTLTAGEAERLWNEGNACNYGNESCQAVSVVLNAPVDNFNSSIETITFNASVTSPINNVVNVSLWLDGTRNETNSSGLKDVDYIFTKNVSDGSHTWFIEACDDGVVCLNSSTRTFIVDTLPPFVNVTYPIGLVGYQVIYGNLTLNWTALDSTIDSCWYDYNGTNVSVTCSENTTNINITNASNKDVRFWANDTGGKVNNSYRTWDYRIFENSQTFSQTTIEGSTETFIANITLGSGETITGVSLNHNGIIRSASQVNLGNSLYNITSSFVIPPVSVDTNVTFFWIINLASGQINSTTNNQTIQNIGIDNCSVHTNVIFNYTIEDEETQVIISPNTTLPTNITLELDIEIFNQDKSVSVINFSTIYNNTNPAGVCLSIDLTNETIYALDSTAKYEADDHEIEYYNIQNFSLSNSSAPQEITLYDLLTADSTEFQITFKDSDFVIVENAIVQINRQYVSEGLFKTVEIPRTDSNGQTVAHLVEKDIVYNIIVLKEGVILGSFNNIVAFCEDVVVGSCFISLNALEAGEAAFDYDEEIGLFSNFSYNETSRNLLFNFVTTDGSVKNVSLSSTKLDQLGNTSVCDTFLVSASGSLLCSVPASIGNETIIVRIFVDGDLKITNYISAGTEFDIGDIGYFLMFFLILSLALMMTGSKIGVIIGVVLGFISSSLLSLFKGGILGVGSSIIWLAIMAMILIWKLNSQRQT